MIKIVKLKMIKIDEIIECSNTRLYGDGKIIGLHRTGNHSQIGKRCGFCKGKYQLVFYYASRFKRVVVKQ